jgi:hypothetical protein
MIGNEINNYANDNDIHLESNCDMISDDIDDYSEDNDINVIIVIIILVLVE